MKRLLISVATIFVMREAMATPVEGSAKATVTTHKDLTCYVYPNYVVQTRDNPGDIGEPIRVYKRSDKTYGCDMGGQSPLLEFMAQTNDDPNYFDGMAGNFMLIGHYTSSLGSLDVYDLSTAKRVHNVGHVTEVRIQGNRSIVYVKYLKTIESTAECPRGTKFKKIDNGIAALISFDTKTGKEREIKRFCRYFE